MISLNVSTLHIVLSLISEGYLNFRCLCKLFHEFQATKIVKDFESKKKKCSLPATLVDHRFFGPVQAI